MPDIVVAAGITWEAVECESRCVAALERGPASSSGRLATASLSINTGVRLDSWFVTWTDKLGESTPWSHGSAA